MQAGGVSSTVDHHTVACKSEDRLLYLLALLRLSLVPRKALIFVNSIDAGFKVKLFLESFGVRAAILNAELPLNSRHHILQEFNRGLFDYLVATDDGKVQPHEGVGRETQRSPRPRLPSALPPAPGSLRPNIERSHDASRQRHDTAPMHSR